MEEKKDIEQQELQRLESSRKDTTIYLTNGFQLHCKILGFDDRVIKVFDLKAGKQELLYRHTVSTIVL